MKTQPAVQLPLQLNQDRRNVDMEQDTASGIIRGCTGLPRPASRSVFHKGQTGDSTAPLSNVNLAAASMHSEGLGMAIKQFTSIWFCHLGCLGRELL